MGKALMDYNSRAKQWANPLVFDHECKTCKTDMLSIHQLGKIKCQMGQYNIFADYQNVWSLHDIHMGKISHLDVFICIHIVVMYQDFSMGILAATKTGLLSHYFIYLCGIIKKERSNSFLSIIITLTSVIWLLGRTSTIARMIPSWCNP